MAPRTHASPLASSPSPPRDSSLRRVSQDLEPPPSLEPLSSCVVPNRRCPVAPRGWQRCGADARVLQGAGCARAAAAVPGVLVQAAGRAAPLSHRSVLQTPVTESGPPCRKWKSVWVCYVNWRSASWFTKTGSLVCTFASQSAILSSHPLGSQVFCGSVGLLDLSTQQHEFFRLCPSSNLHPDVNGTRCRAVSGFGCTHCFQD